MIGLPLQGPILPEVVVDTGVNVINENVVHGGLFRRHFLILHDFAYKLSAYCIKVMLAS